MAGKKFMKRKKHQVLQTRMVPQAFGGAERRRLKSKNPGEFGVGNFAALPGEEDVPD